VEVFWRGFIGRLISSFADKLVLVTGASAGVGRQTALDFAAQGAKLLLVARRKERLQQLADQIRAAGGAAEVLPCDLSDNWSRDRLISDLLTRHLIPDILINNAGYGNYRLFIKEPPAEVARMMAVNYQACADLMSAFLPEMLKRGSGALVNVSSTAGRVAVPNMGAYCAAKSALCALTESVAYELRGSGVTVHLVNPGPIKTEFFDAGVWQGPRPRDRVSAQSVSHAIQKAIRKKKMITYIPPQGGCLVYVFHLLGPLGRWAVSRRK